MLIPNEELANSRVTNMTIIDPVSLAQVRLTLPAAADPTRVRAILDEQAQTVPGRLLDRPGPAAAVAEVGAEGTVYTVGVWMPDAAQVAAAAATLRERCLARLHDEGLVAEPDGGGDTVNGPLVAAPQPVRRRARPRRRAAAQAPGDRAAAAAAARWPRPSLVVVGDRLRLGAGGRRGGGDRGPLKRAEGRQPEHDEAALPGRHHQDL